MSYHAGQAPEGVPLYPLAIVEQPAALAKTDNTIRNLLLAALAIGLLFWLLRRKSPSASPGQTSLSAADEQALRSLRNRMSGGPLSAEEAREGASQIDRILASSAS